MTNGTQTVEQAKSADGQPPASGVYAHLVFRTRNKALKKDVLRHDTLIGSAQGCHIQIVSAKVSRAHCIVSLEAGRLRVRDLQSRAGTKVNGTRVDFAYLADGDRLEVGPIVFRVATNLPSDAIPPAKGQELDRQLPGCDRENRIGEYQVQEVLGAGGMGWLYRAIDPKTNQPVVLKVLSDKDSTDSGLRARFEQEARAGVKLAHPNIVRTHKFQEAEGVFGKVLYVVMEYVEGTNLLEYIERYGKLAWPLACDFMSQAAAGLQFIHEGGIIHRDVKPSNLLIETNGHVRLLDFGLAKLDEHEDELSLAMIFGQDCLGTSDYIAPEQTLNSFTVTPAADIYSLGCTFYVTLTARAPYPFKTVAEKLEAHRTKKPKPVREIVPAIPAELAAVLDKMMAKDPKQRYQTAAQVVEALKPFAERSPVSFDYQAILATRVTEAYRRMDALKQRSQAKAPAATVAAATAGSSTQIPKAGSTPKVSATDSTTRVSESDLLDAPARLASGSLYDEDDRERTSISTVDSSDIVLNADDRDQPLDPELARLIASWPTLPKHIRLAIHALVDVAHD